MLNRNKDQKGFTLIELIVVLAVASVLTAVFVPQFYHYVGNSKKSSCRQARENLLAVFERKVYAGDIALTSAGITDFLESPEFEVTDNTCPESGTYSGRLDPINNRIYIECNIPGHDDFVFADLEEFTEASEGDDNLIPIPTIEPIPTPSVTEEVPTEGEPTPIPTPTPAIWPYLDDTRWEEFKGQDKNNMYVDVSVPSGLFQTPRGNWYVIVGSGTTFRIMRNQMNDGFPEYYGGPEDYRDKNYLIKYSGVTWTEETLHFINNNSQFEGVRYGDIVICNGVSYINQNLGGADKGNWPLSGNQSDNFYKVNP